MLSVNLPSPVARTPRVTWGAAWQLSFLWGFLLLLFCFFKFLFLTKIDAVSPSSSPGRSSPESSLESRGDPTPSFPFPVKENGPDWPGNPRAGTKGSRAGQGLVQFPPPPGPPWGRAEAGLGEEGAGLVNKPTGATRCPEEWGGVCWPPWPSGELED
jgi:hypothetical protein